MEPTGIKAIIVREGVEAALMLVYKMVSKLMDELNVPKPTDAPDATSQPVTGTEEGK